MANLVMFWTTTWLVCWSSAAFMAKNKACSDVSPMDTELCGSCLVSKSDELLIPSSYWNSEINGCVCHLYVYLHNNFLESGKMKKSSFFPKWTKALLLEYHAQLNQGQSDDSLCSFAFPNNWKVDDARVHLDSWEVLGPIPVGKLEMDADPAFDTTATDSMPSDVGNKSPWDVGQHVLGLSSTAYVSSEHSPDGHVQWKAMLATNSRRGLVVDAKFSINWNSLVQGLSTMAVQEMQGWARTTTYIHLAGVYDIHCTGVHTVYIRTQNSTRLLVGDIYTSGRVRGSAFLSTGLVGVVLPLRGLGGASFMCHFTPATPHQPIVSLGVSNIPNLLQLHRPSNNKLSMRMKKDMSGILLSSVFSVLLKSSHSAVVNLTFQVKMVDKMSPTSDNQLGADFVVHIPNTWKFGSLAPDGSSFSIQPGQVVSLPLEILKKNHMGADDNMVILPCPAVFEVVVLPSIGQPISLPLEFGCRLKHQSFLVSYIDLDGSAVQAAVLLPLPYHASEQDVAPAMEFPVLLSLHGTGISATSQADAYKMKHHPSDPEYTFGVRGLWVVAPSREGAHNWEGIGANTAQYSLSALQQLFSHYAAILPQMMLSGGIMAGHSMGGHGALVGAVNNPGAFQCLSPAASWIRKEEYGAGNSFFSLDISNTFVPLGLKHILELTMSEYHVDRLMDNIHHMKVHIRIGRDDMTTHPWYSRRLHRVLQHKGIFSTLEEVHDKQHWWWDTDGENDGGVLNDSIMRYFYASCVGNSNPNHNSSHSGSQVANSESVLSDDGTIVDVTTTLSNPSGLDSRSNPTYNQDMCRQYVLSVVNPATHLGLCGIHVVQQHKAMVETVIRVQCKYGTASTGRQHCTVLSGGNVRRLFVDANAILTHQDTDLTVDGIAINLQPATGAQIEVQVGVAVCWNDNSFMPAICTSPIHPLLEKSALTSGPVRNLYIRPFMIVYGTNSQDGVLLRAIKDFATYVANAHTAAHSTFVPIVADRDYLAKANAHWRQSNVMFVGGPAINVAMTARCASHETVSNGGDGNNDVYYCMSPISFKNSSISVADGEEGSSSFQVGSYNFPDRDFAAIYVLPIDTHTGSCSKRHNRHGGYGRDECSESAMAVCVHATTAQDFLHLSRLAWPVVPPMVRSPFAEQIPEVLILKSADIWSHGWGAVRMAGYWNSTWQLGSDSMYIANDLSASLRKEFFH